jgi:hypothetical protein
MPFTSIFGVKALEHSMTPREVSMLRRSVLLTGWLLGIAGALGLIVALTSQSPAARPHVLATAGGARYAGAHVLATAGGARYAGAYVYATNRPAKRNPGNGLSTNPNFFPIMVWYQGTANVSAYRALGVNMFEAPDAYSSADLNILKSAGMTVIECSTSGNPGRRYLGADGKAYPLYNPQTCQGGSRGDSSASVIKGWFDLPDEPDTAQSTTTANSYGPCVAPSFIQKETRAIKAGDSATPRRAVVVNFNAGVALNTKDRGAFCHYHADYYARYMRGATIATFDLYSRNYSLPLDAPSLGVSNLHAWMTAAGQDKPVMPILETTPIDTGNKGPRAADLRFETWSTIIAGANGIGYFCHIISPSFNEAGCLSIARIRAQMSTDDAQIRSLAPVLNSNTVTPGVTVSASVKVHVMTKRSGGYTYAFADADGASGGNATFRVPDGRDGTVTVLGERRTLKMTNGSFSDSFAGYGVHLYQIR